MPDRFSLPLIIDKDGKGEAHIPERLPFGSPPFSEGELQGVLEKHPELLPVELVDPIFGPPVCIGREVSTGSGPLDNLYVSPNGYITIVETKLWKNPEARRSVVGQIIDYTKQLAKWNYAKLQEAFRDYAKQAGIAHEKLFDYICEQADDDLDEAGFIDAVERCLSHGRFLLLIVGDGIREGMADMVSYLQETPNIQFTLALVEIGCYKVEVGGDGLLLLVPRIVARTAEIERAIVRIEMSEEARKLVEVETKTPKQPLLGRKKATSLTKEEFYDLLANAAGGDNAEGTRTFLDALMEKHDLLVEDFSTSRLAIRMGIPGTDMQPQAVLMVTKSGFMLAGRVILNNLRKAGYSPELVQGFWRRLAEINPDLAPQRGPDGKLRVKKGTGSNDIGSLMPHFAEIEEAVLDFARDVERASEEVGA